MKTYHDCTSKGIEGIRINPRRERKENNTLATEMIPCGQQRIPYTKKDFGNFATDQKDMPQSSRVKCTKTLPVRSQC